MLNYGFRSYRNTCKSPHINVAKAHTTRIETTINIVDIHRYILICILSFEVLHIQQPNEVDAIDQLTLNINFIFLVYKHLLINISDKYAGLLGLLLFLLSFGWLVFYCIHVKTF